MAAVGVRLFGLGGTVGALYPREDVGDEREVASLCCSYRPFGWYCLPPRLLRGVSLQWRQCSLVSPHLTGRTSEVGLLMGVPNRYIVGI